MFSPFYIVNYHLIVVLQKYFEIISLHFFYILRWQEMNGGMAHRRIEQENEKKKLDGKKGINFNWMENVQSVCDTPIFFFVLHIFPSIIYNIFYVPFYPYTEIHILIKNFMCFYFKTHTNEKKSLTYKCTYINFKIGQIYDLLLKFHVAVLIRIYVYIFSYCMICVRMWIQFLWVHGKKRKGIVIYSMSV